MPICAHCGAPAPAGDPAFCCGGCAAAYSLLRSCGLGDFHKLRGDAPAAPVQSIQEDWAAWSDPAFAAVHARPLRSGHQVITWAVEGIHCPACIWVLERLSFLEPGVLQATLDLSCLTLRVVYDPAKTDPGRQAATIARLGYRLLPYRSSAEIAARTRERRRLLLGVAVSTASAVGSMHLAMNLYAGDMVQDLETHWRHLFGWGSVAAALPAAFYGAAPWWPALGRAVTGRGWSADATGALVVAAGLAASVAGVLGNGPVYADAVAMFVALLLLGRLLLATAQEKVRTAAGRLGGLLPDLARSPDGTWRAAAELVQGAEILVHPGERLPADGRASDLPDGDAWIDTMVLTGEAKAQRVVPGEPLFAGTVCVGGRIRLRVEAAGRATRVAGLVERAGILGTAPTGDPALAAWSRWVGAAAILGGLALWLTGTDGATATARAMGVLMAACPCAVGLGLPLLRAHALGCAAARGILIRDPGLIDRLTLLRHAVLDKTGTLTRGQVVITAWEWLAEPVGTDRATVIALAVAGERQARHPLAAALVAWAGEVPDLAIASWEEIPGAGLRIRTESGELRLGTTQFTGVDLGTDPTLVLGVSWAGHPLARITASDPLREDAQSFVSWLEQRELSVHLASGDREAAARHAGEILGLGEDRIHGDCTPEAKETLVRRLDGPVLMVGDGVNDAGALAAAAAGVAVRGGLAAALEGSHVFITDAGEALARVRDLIQGAAQVRRREHVLIAWSWIYNLVAVVGALAGWWGPLGCAVAMPLSSLLAVWWARRGDPFNSASRT